MDSVRLHYLLNEKPANGKDVVDCLNIVAINDEREKKVIHGFKTESDFKRWVSTSRYSDSFQRLQQKIEESRTQMERDNIELQNDILEGSFDRMQKLNDLSRELDLPISSEEFVKEAKRRKIIKSCFLWDRERHKGAFRFVGTLPDFRWIGFNDKTSSGIFVGVCGLFEHIWYRGKSVWFVGIFSAPRLAEFRFDNMASSAITT